MLCIYIHISSYFFFSFFNLHWPLLVLFVFFLSFLYRYWGVGVGGGGFDVTCHANKYLLRKAFRVVQCISAMFVVIHL